MFRTFAQTQKRAVRRCGLHRERLAWVAQTKRLSPNIFTRVFKLVQLKGREHAHLPREVAHYMKLSEHAAVRCSQLCRRFRSFRCRKLWSERLMDRHTSSKKTPDVRPSECGLPVALHADVVLFGFLLIAAESAPPTGASSLSEILLSTAS